MDYELEDFDKYYTIQIWSHKDPTGNSLEELTKKLLVELKHKHNAQIAGIEGPTPFLPDFFSELYGKYNGYLIAVKKNCSPLKLKETCIKYETQNKKRICDIYVYISKDKSIHRKDLKQFD